MKMPKNAQAQPRQTDIYNVHMEPIESGFEVATSRLRGIRLNPIFLPIGWKSTYCEINVKMKMMTKLATKLFWVACIIKKEHVQMIETERAPYKHAHEFKTVCPRVTSFANTVTKAATAKSFIRSF